MNDFSMKELNLTLKIHIVKKLNALGLPLEDITFSVSHCQGDFVKTVGEIEDYDLYFKHLEEKGINIKELKELNNDLDLRLTLDKYREVYIETYSDKDVDKFERILADDIQEIFNDLLHECYEICDNWE